jgi:transcriptional regulator with XRE-family HTH domain
MGRSRRPRPARLAAKLRQIRTALGLTQQEMFEHLGETRTTLYRGHIGLYETGQRTPSMLVVLQYARVAGVPMELLVDDDLDLPDRLPCMPHHEWIMRPVRSSKHHR